MTVIKALVGLVVPVLALIALASCGPVPLPEQAVTNQPLGGNVRAEKVGLLDGCPLYRVYEYGKPGTSYVVICKSHM